MKTPTIVTILCLGGLALPETSFSQEVAVAIAAEAGQTGLPAVNWAELSDEGDLPSGGSVKQDPAHGDVLSIEVSGTEEEPIRLVTIEQPGITKRCYQVEGMIRYEGVSQPGYLEMWSCFEEGERYFSRTLNRFGPLGRISGTSDWRRFVLPFDLQDEESAGPDRLEVNLVLPAGGQVQVSGMKLTESDSPRFGGRAAWNNPGLVVGLLGALFGVCGSIFHWSRQSGRWWSVMRYFPLVSYGCGAFALLIALFSFVSRWSWDITYSSALLGVILILVIAGNEWYYRRLKQEGSPSAEVRRMQAFDA